MGKILARVVRRAARPLAAATSRNLPFPSQLPGRACPAPTGWCSVDIPPTDCCRGRRPRRPADACAAVDAPGGINPSPTTDLPTAAHANPRAAYMPPLRCHINVIRAHSICARARLRRRNLFRADMESVPAVGVGVLDDPGRLPLPRSSCGRTMFAPTTSPPKTTAARSGLTPERAAVFLSNDYCISPHTSCA